MATTAVHASDLDGVKHLLRGGPCAVLGYLKSIVLTQVECKDMGVSFGREGAQLSAGHHPDSSASQHAGLPAHRPWQDPDSCRHHAQFFSLVSRGEPGSFHPQNCCRLHHREAKPADAIKKRTNSPQIMPSSSPVSRND